MQQLKCAGESVYLFQYTTKIIQNFLINAFQYVPYHRHWVLFRRGVMLCEISYLNQTFSSTSFVERITCQFLIHMVYSQSVYV